MTAKDVLMTAARKNRTAKVAPLPDLPDMATASSTTIRERSEAAAAAWKKNKQASLATSCAYH